MITANILAKKTDVPVYTVRHYTKSGSTFLDFKINKKDLT